MDTKQDDLHKIFETVVHGGTISVGMDALANLQNLAISNEVIELNSMSADHIVHY